MSVSLFFNGKMQKSPHSKDNSEKDFLYGRILRNKASQRLIWAKLYADGPATTSKESTDAKQ